MTHNIRGTSKPLSKWSRRKQPPLKKRAQRKLAAKVIKLLTMEAEATKAVAGAGSSPSPSDGQSMNSGAGISLDSNSEFYNTGRVGRRNALPDILNHHHSATSTADLPDKLSALSTSDGPESSATSK